MPWTIPGILLCLLLRVEWVAAAEQEDPTFAADMAQIRRTRAASIAKLTNLLRQIDLTAVQRREAALLLPLETLSAAISAPSEAAQIPLVSFLQDEVLEKTMYHPDARLTFIFGELALQLMGANDGLLNSNLIDRTAWIARQTRIFRQVTRWHAAVTEKNAEKPAPSIPLPFTNWEVITSNEYLAAAHGRLSRIKGPSDDTVRRIRDRRTIERFVKRVRVSGKMTDMWQQATAEERIRLRNACEESPLAILLPADQGEKP